MQFRLSVLLAHNMLSRRGLVQCGFRPHLTQLLVCCRRVHILVQVLEFIHFFWPRDTVFVIIELSPPVLQPLRLLELILLGLGSDYIFLGRLLLLGLDLNCLLGLVVEHLSLRRPGPCSGFPLLLRN